MNQVTVQSDVSCFQLGPSAGAGVSGAAGSLFSGAAGAGAGAGSGGVSPLPPQPASRERAITIASTSASHFFVFILFSSSFVSVLWCRGDQPLIAPTVTPLTKYRCKNG